MTAADKLQPTPTPESAAYWEACNEGRLVIQRCGACGHHQFYPRLLCTRCMSGDLGWHEASGQGRVKSFTIIRRPVTEAYADDVPYVVALIELAEGPTMMSNVVDCDPETVAIGMAVGVDFERRTEELAVPVFRPA